VHEGIEVLQKKDRALVEIFFSNKTFILPSLEIIIAGLK
jgi:hypothetical protein